jgi:hypothetical protein
MNELTDLEKTVVEVRSLKYPELPEQLIRDILSIQATGGPAQRVLKSMESVVEAYLAREEKP